MTFSEAKKNHKALWTWLAENPKNMKHDWPRWRYNGGDIEEVEADCFACNFLDEHYGGFPHCSKCPINWIGLNCIDEKRYNDFNGLFSQWRLTHGKKRLDLARQIANLPWRTR